MRFLEVNEIAQWCRERDILLDEHWRLLDDPTLTHTSRVVHSPTGRTGKEPAVAASCISALGSYETLLVWVVDWDIWSSSEDWPRYYALRGKVGERRSLSTAPGHLFSAGESDLLLELLTQILENGWEAHVLPSDAASVGRRIRCCHDGFTELQLRRPGTVLAAV